MKVTPGGSGPFRYQWYNGFSGMTSSPVEGATSAELQTPPITGRQFRVHHAAVIRGHELDGGVACGV